MSVEIQFLDKDLYLKKIDNIRYDQRYWKNTMENRWNYIFSVIGELKKRNPKTVLEIGAYGINLTNVSDNMDLLEMTIDQDNLNNKKYIIDARKVPYPIFDKYYDIIVGLSVFEHLGPDQSIIFEEFMRISKSVILSFPYKWKTDPICFDEDFNIDDEVIGGWTKYYLPTNIIYIESRVIYVFDF